MANPWDLLASEMPTEEELLAIQASQPQGAMETSNFLMEQSSPPSGKKIKVSVNPWQKQQRAAYLEDREQQKKGIGSLEKRQDAFRKGSGQIDLSPLLALADAWGGTNMARVYKAPMSDDQREQLALRLEDELQQRRNELTKLDRDFLKDQATFEVMQGRQGEKQDLMLESDVKRLKSDIVPLSNQAANISAIDALISKYDPKKLPGYGSWKEKITPDALLDEDARDLRRLMNDLSAAALQAQSGATVSERERAAKLNALAQNLSSKPEDLYTAYMKFKEAASLGVKAREAGYRPEVVERYRERMGQDAITAERVGASPYQKAAPQKQQFQEGTVINVGGKRFKIQGGKPVPL